jgi:D-alanyl-D-alanine carboxypeptidase/D-alanyl-D-alanine-endopeptidase (penicillin-binding protein 4)
MNRWHSIFLTLLMVAAPLVSAQALPSEIEQALSRAKLPRDAVALLVVDAQTGSSVRLSHRAQASMNPASVMKLVNGPVRDGVLQGNLYIKGQGDPKLVVERLWLLLHRVQGLGVRQITGDIVLDRSAFEPIVLDPAEFDGEPLRPYNAAPDALLINYKAVVMTFVPDPQARLARVHIEPTLSGVQMQTSVPLSALDCGDYRAALKADFVDPARIRFGGQFAAACGEKTWPVAYADPASYAARAVGGLWHDMGGRLDGKVREGKTPGGLSPSFEWTSPPLTEVIRDINKFSNNVMARQLFLTLGLRAGSRPDGAAGVGTLAGAREVVRAWWQDSVGAQASAGRTGEGVAPPLLDNGSGLSRQERISAAALARLLQVAYRSPMMSELMSSLPISGVDGTLRRSKSKLTGVAHLKTGSLRDVAALAGYVDGLSGRRYVLVALVNHAGAAAARPVLDALIDWTARDQ